MRLLKNPFLWLIVIFILFVAFLVATVGERLVNKFLPDNPWPALQASGQSDPALIPVFSDLITQSYNSLGNAYTSYDMSDFSQFYVDEPTVPLNREQSKFVDEIKANQSKAGLSSGLTGQGYLAYCRALILNSGSGAQAYQLQATLAAQGKTMSPDDYRKVGAPMPESGAAPTAMPSFSDTVSSSSYQWKVNFGTVTVEANRAEVTYLYGDGWGVMHAFLVKTLAGWRIAGERRLKS